MEQLVVDNLLAWGSEQAAADAGVRDALASRRSRRDNLRHDPFRRVGRSPVDRFSRRSLRRGRLRTLRRRRHRLRRCPIVLEKVTEPALPAQPRTMAGSWEFSNADREKTCTITFRDTAASKVGKRVEFDPNCVKQLCVHS